MTIQPSAQFPMGRRAVLGGGVALALSGCGDSAADDPKSVIVQLGGGDWQAANLAAYAAPFQKATGIRVIPIAEDTTLAKLKLFDAAGRAEVDVVNLSSADAFLAAGRSYLAGIDYGRFRPADRAGLAGEARQPWGVGSLFYSHVIGYRSGIARPPASWQDFWNVAAFPGRRSLRSGADGSGPWEEALLADGVAPDALYPLDLDRVFRSLDRIKPAIRRWWALGSEVQQLLRDGAADMANCYDGRLALLKRAGAPVDFTYSQGKLALDYWAIPAGAPHRDNAQQFIAFVARADRQADFARRFAAGPTNLDAYRGLDPAFAGTLPSHPDNLARQVLRNGSWYAQTGADGRSNVERLIERWNGWVLQ